ncbi:MAG: hypothetical protein NVS4B7_17180 [Ktedonobacteraceae bacterium]
MNVHILGKNGSGEVIFMHIKLTAAAKTDVGKQREQNEDSIYKRIEALEDGDRGLFIVADGMGGYQAGEVASKLAVETISRALDSFFQPLADQPTIQMTPAPAQPDLDETVKLTQPKAEKQLENGQHAQNIAEMPLAHSIEEQLTAAVQKANKAIVSYGEQQTASRGLGCTVTMALIYNDQAYIANVGDSRTYLLRNGELNPLTKDHSLVARLVETRQIKPEEVYSHPQRNLIYRSLGAGRTATEVDIYHTELHPNDILLLCSDGLWEMVHHQNLLKELSEKSSLQHICDTLIDLANVNGGVDNISAIVAQVGAS